MRPIRYAISGTLAGRSVYVGVDPSTGDYTLEGRTYPSLGRPDFFRQLENLGDFYMTYEDERGHQCIGKVANDDPAYLLKFFTEPTLPIPELAERQPRSWGWPVFWAGLVMVAVGAVALLRRR